MCLPKYSGDICAALVGFFKRLFPIPLLPNAAARSTTS